MKIVIQCAGRKRADAGTFVTTTGKPILFVARPDLKPQNDNQAFARPDDLSDDGLVTWRKRLEDYNLRSADQNPLHLLPAYQLYLNEVYRDLVSKFGLGSVYILSAGWGLIPGEFLTPKYDITFSKGAGVERYAQRGKRDFFDDFAMLPDDDEIRFLGGRDYLPTFCKLTKNLKGRKMVYFPEPPNKKPKERNLPGGFEVKTFRTEVRTNWHYECARALLQENQT